MWYNVDFNKLKLLLLPISLRKSAFKSFLNGVFQSFQEIHDRFIANRVIRIYKLEHTGQVNSLRKSLNDSFDVQQRRITIKNGNQHDRFYIYTRGEQKPYLLGSKLIYSPDDYADTGVDFIVCVPSDIVALKEYDLIAHINFYKEGSKKFKIEKI